MIHPYHEWRTDPLGCGIFYGSLIEAGAVASFLPGIFSEPPSWFLIPPALLAIMGFLTILAGIVSYERHK